MVKKAQVSDDDFVEDDESKNGIVIDTDDLDDDKQKEGVIEKEDGSAEVDLTNVDEDVDPQDLRRQQKMHNANFAQKRLDKEKKRLSEELEETRKENERLKKERETAGQPTHAPTVTAPGAPERPLYKGVPIPQTDAEWDALGKRNWRMAMEMQSHITASEVTRNERSLEKATEVLEKNKTRVLERHPELHDGNSEKSRIYMNILKENPQYLNDPKGPVHAMRDMEEYMKESLGYRDEEIVAAERRGASKEMERSSRVALSGVKGKQSTFSSEKKVTLTRDEMDFCKQNRLDPREYARNKMLLSKSRGGLQV